MQLGQTYFWVLGGTLKCLAYFYVQQSGITHVMAGISLSSYNHVRLMGIPYLGIILHATNV